MRLLFSSKNSFPIIPTTPICFWKTNLWTTTLFNFLETTITYKGFTKFDVKHLDKNVDSLLHHNKLKKIKTIHASSFAPKPQATNIVLNTLHRINNNCSSDSLKTLATLEHIYVATHFGYKKKHFRNALKKMHATTDNSLWDTLTAILNDDFWHTYSASTRLLTHSILSTPHGHHTNPWILSTGHIDTYA